MLNNKFECPEGFKECIVLETFSSGKGVRVERAEKSYAILSINNEYLGEVYCSDPNKCVLKYIFQHPRKMPEGIKK